MAIPKLHFTVAVAGFMGSMLLQPLIQPSDSWANVTVVPNDIGVSIQNAPGVPPHRQCTLSSEAGATHPRALKNAPRMHYQEVPACIRALADKRVYIPVLLRGYKA